RRSRGEETRPAFGGDPPPTPDRPRRLTVGGYRPGSAFGHFSDEAREATSRWNRTLPACVRAGSGCSLDQNPFPAFGAVAAHVPCGQQTAQCPREAVRPDRIG